MEASCHIYACRRYYDEFLTRLNRLAYHTLSTNFTSDKAEMSLKHAIVWYGIGDAAFPAVVSQISTGGDMAGDRDLFPRRDCLMLMVW